MDSPYRNARTPLQDRREALRSELAATTKEVEALQDVQARQQALESELHAVEHKLRRAHAKRALPLLGQVRVASPCSANWDDMVGDDRARLCGSCAKNVYDLSAMTADEAEDFLEATFGADTCVRFYRRADGTILTSDCPVGISRKRVRRIAGAALALATTAVASASALLVSRPTMGDTMIGRQPVQAPPTQAMGEVMGMLPVPESGPAPRGSWTMGAPPPRLPYKGAKHPPKCEPGDPLCGE